MNHELDRPLHDAGRKAPPTVLTQDEVNDFEVLVRMAAMLRDQLNELVVDMSRITDERADEDDGWGNTVAWDVIYNGSELGSVLRRCNLALPGAMSAPGLSATQGVAP